MGDIIAFPARYTQPPVFLQRAGLSYADMLEMCNRALRAATDPGVDHDAAHLARQTLAHIAEFGGYDQIRALASRYLRIAGAGPTGGDAA